MEPNRIPAANIDDVDLSSIDRASPADAADVLRIKRLIASGGETDQDLIRLCELLFKHGEVETSEDLLRSNVVDVGDVIHGAYTRLHGHAVEGVLDRAVDDFSRQFGVRLELKRSRGFLKHEYSSQPGSLPAGVDSRIARYLSRPCLVEFKYDPQGCLAEITCREPALSQTYLLLRDYAGKWGIGR